MTDPLEGIREKLKRSDECIGNLDREIRAFFDESLYPILPHQNENSLKKAVDYHTGRPIPIRFSVFAGEVAHHLRASLDHLAWLLSDASYRSSHATSIQFPILDHAPTKDEQSRYNRKVAGMSLNARELILFWQPYKLRPGGDAREDPLAILHNLDRLDKHVEVALIFTAFNRRLLPSVLSAILAHRQAKSQATLRGYERAVKMDIKITPQVAFKDFGTAEIIPVCVRLSMLAEIVRNVIEELKSEIAW